MVGLRIVTPPAVTPPAVAGPPSPPLSMKPALFTAPVTAPTLSKVPVLPVSGAVRLPELLKKPALTKLAVAVNVPVFTTVPAAELAKFAAFQVPLLEMPPALERTSPVHAP